MISNAFLREFDWQRRRFVGYLQIECHTGWWDELGALRGVQRAKLSVWERGCVFDFWPRVGVTWAFEF